MAQERIDSVIVDPNGRVHVRKSAPNSDLSGLSREELLSESERTLEDLANIRAQVDVAKRKHAAAGTWADPVWLTRAEAALRHKGRRHQAILLRLSQLRDASAKASQAVFACEFVEVARRRLRVETFAAIAQETNDCLEGKE